MSIEEWCKRAAQAIWAGKNLKHVRIPGDAPDSSKDVYLTPVIDINGLFPVTKPTDQNKKAVRERLEKKKSEAIKAAEERIKSREVGLTNATELI